MTARSQTHGVDTTPIARTFTRARAWTVPAQCQSHAVSELRCATRLPERSRGNSPAPARWSDGDDPVAGDGTEAVVLQKYDTSIGPGERGSVTARAHVANGARLEHQRPPKLVPRGASSITLCAMVLPAAGQPFGDEP